MKSLRLLMSVMALTVMTLPALAEFLPVKVNPADGSTLERLGKITAEWDTDWLDDYTDEVCGEVLNSSNEVVTTLTCEIEFLDPICYFYPEEPVTEDGEYTVVIFANTVLSADDEWNERFELHYKIGEAEPEFMSFVESDPENYSTVPALTNIQTLWSEVVDEINTDLTVSVYDSLTNEWVADMNVIKDFFELNGVVLILESPIERDGNYTIMLPEGLLRNSNGVISEAMELNFTVDITTGLKNISEDGHIKVDKNRIISLTENEIAIYNCDGSFVAKIPAMGEISMDAGMYLILITDEERNSTIKLYVK